MLVERHHKFNEKFPEEFPWHAVSQKSISEAAPLIVAEIYKDLKTKERLYAPGLRNALVLMALVCTLAD